MNESLYSFIEDPSSKRRDLLNLAVESIELIKRTDSLKEVRERKSMVMDALGKEIAITKKAIRHFQNLMPVKIHDKKEKVIEKVMKKKVIHQRRVEQSKISNLELELEHIKEKLNKLDF